MLPIQAIAETLGLTSNDLIPYGRDHSNPPVTQAGTVHGEFTFAVTVPEPAAAVALGVVAPLLLVRARRTIPSARTGSRSMPRPAAGYADLPGCR